MADVFISYSQKDRTRSEAVGSMLRRAAYSVAIDRDFLLTGDAYRQQIADELRNAKVVIVLWSAHAVESPFVRDEASRATRRTVLLQLIIDDMPDGDVPLGFGELQWLRCKWTAEGELAEESREGLLAALKRHLPAIEPLGAAIDQLQREVNCKLGDDYELMDRIGTGRMSIVFKARHPVYGVVALKVTPLAGILLLPGFYAEFRDSIDAARPLSHANILRIREVRLLETVACTAMDYVEGGSLANLIAKAGARFPLGRIKDIACDIAEALAHAHVNGVVHCSLSPSDVLIAAPLDRAVVSDFGMPNVGSGPEATAAKALFLDARYVSPEQCVGDQASPQSDQYSFGAILYEMLTGRPPFVGKSAFATMRNHCDDVPRPVVEYRPACPLTVANSVMRLLSKKPKDRYLTTSMLAHEIAAWPLAESVRRTGQLFISGPERSAKAALESYNRCLADADFLAAFYQRLLEDPALASHLENMNFDRQVAAVERAIRHLLEYAQGHEDARRELERVAAGHQRFRLEERHLRKFVEALIDLAVERDPQAIDAPQRDRLRDEWRNSTEIGLQRFAEVAQIALQRVSGVVTRGDPAAVPVGRR